MDTPKSLIEAIKFFSEYENCRKFMVLVRWSDGVVKCPTCGSNRVTYLEKARVYKCRTVHPKQKFSLKTGTVYEDSPIGLEKWLPASWLLSNCKNGISSYELARDLGVTQKTAWFMLQRIRLAMQDTFDGGKLKGEVEVDETFIGGKARNRHLGKRKKAIQGRGATGKTVVMGMLERGGKVKAHVIAERDKKTLHGKIAEHVEAGSHIMTDELISYWGLEQNYMHSVVNHAEAYVDGIVSTNGLENFWSLLKRGLNGPTWPSNPFTCSVTSTSRLLDSTIAVTVMPDDSSKRCRRSSASASRSRRSLVGGCRRRIKGRPVEQTANGLSYLRQGRGKRKKL